MPQSLWKQYYTISEIGYKKVIHNKIQVHFYINIKSASKIDLKRKLGNHPLKE